MLMIRQPIIKERPKIRLAPRIGNELFFIYIPFLIGRSSIFDEPAVFEFAFMPFMLGQQLFAHKSIVLIHSQRPVIPALRVHHNFVHPLHFKKIIHRLSHQLRTDTLIP
ncbi:hypothetical protein D3C81_1830260 [compost metagenome]